MEYRLTDFLPTTKKELELRGWDEVDVILFSADAYVDHPSFGAAVIGRTLEAAGFRVAIVPQPDWHGDFRDFKKLGRPRLFFGISPGCMDSMVNKYTANRRLRSEDAYSPDGRHDLRPEYPTIVYSKILRQLYPDVPIVLGGIEASLRRLTHYDYWQDRLRPCILYDAPADLLIYGMGEKPIVELARRLSDALSTTRASDGSPIATPPASDGSPIATTHASDGSPIGTIRDIPQTVYLTNAITPTTDDIVLHSHEECLKSKRSQAENFRHIEEQSNMMHAHRLLQPFAPAAAKTPSEAAVPVAPPAAAKTPGEAAVPVAPPAATKAPGEAAVPSVSTLGPSVVVNPPYPPMTTAEIDASFDLPYTRLPHPKYKGKRIPAYEMIKHSINIHRGCFGGCAFCTISAHQGKFITCRSKESILREVRQVVQMDDFTGYISDLGGPSANMYGMHGRNINICEKCKRPSCIHPQICPNLDTDHSKLLDIYHAVDALPEVKKSFIGSGVRYDLLLYHSKDEHANRAAQEYTRELITRHVSGRLKVAPEHTSDHVLNLMRKPSFQQFYDFKRQFDRICREEGLRQQIIPYFISSHPGCTEADMAELAIITKRLDFQLEQVQDFTPTPMTVSTETWYSGYNPYTLEPVQSAKSQREKLAQRQYFFWYKPEERRNIEQSLHRIGRADLISELCPPNINKPHNTHQAHSSHNSHANPRTEPRRQEPEKGQRRRRRRHP